MAEDLTSSGFLNAWNGVPGFSLNPYMNYCRTIIRNTIYYDGLAPWLEDVNTIIDTCLTDAMQAVYEKIDTYDDRWPFKVFLANKCRYAFRDYIKKNESFNKKERLEEGITGMLVNEEDPHRLVAEKEVSAFNKDLLANILKIVSGFSDEQRKIFETAYQTKNWTIGNVNDVLTIMDGEAPCANTVKYIGETFDITAGNVRTILSRLRERIRKNLWQGYGLDRAAYNRGNNVGFALDEPKITQEEIDSLTNEQCLLIWALMRIKSQR